MRVDEGIRHVGAAAELLDLLGGWTSEATPAELADFLVGLYWRMNLP